jgi:hypothetical protein
VDHISAVLRWLQKQEQKTVTLLYLSVKRRCTNHLYVQNYNRRPTLLRVLGNGGSCFQNWLGVQASVAKPTNVNTYYEELYYKTGFREVQRHSCLHVTLLGTPIKRK